MNPDKLKQQLSDPITHDLFLHFNQKVEVAVSDLIARLSEAHEQPERPYRQVVITKLTTNFIRFAAESAHSIDMPRWVWDSMCNELWRTIEAVKSKYIPEKKGANERPQ